MKKWVKRFSKLPMATVVIALLLSYGSCFVHPSTYGYLMVFGLFYPLILAFSVVVLIFYLFIRPLYGIVIILAIGLGLPWWPVYFSFGNVNQAPDVSYSIVSFNSQSFFSKNNKGTYVFSEDKLKSWVKNTELKNADIITVQEANKKKESEINSILNRRYSATHIAPRIGLYSRFPFSDTVKKKGNNSTNGLYEVQMIADTDTFNLISVHLQSNRLRANDVHSINDGAWTGKNKYKSLWHSMRSYKQHAIARADQVEFILERVRQSRYPVIVAGDFNDVPMSYISQEMRGELRDAYAISGRGLSSSLRSLSGLKIDYIYVSEEIDVYDCHVIRSGYSDHFPVYAEWNIR